MNIFLISPVRGVDQAENLDVVTRLEIGGNSVHWPYRDTNQDDDTGLKICQDNLKAIQEADEVHIIWDGKSQGCLFDLGIAFALGKKIVPTSLPAATPGKCFQSMIRAYSCL